ncbi:MAG: tRNA lysidine(34) synthetase TilS [Alistipes sp.]|nr:tRNA lysidine(34) synthetase TilS [Candidatus Alistipes equi]
MDLRKGFEDYVSIHGLFTLSSRILLAVSGGVDSMVMLDLFVSLGYHNIAIAHCNFSLRSEESDGDEELVVSTAKRYGIKLYSIRFDTKAEMAQSGDSMEMAARRLRYNWFEELCQREGYEFVSVAHHADDSIETFFINLLRGTGLRGLSGIACCSGRVRRPLLFASREDILCYAKKNNIAFREDSSNNSTAYLRNKIRLLAVPLFRSFNERFNHVMRGNLGRLQATQKFLSSVIEKIESEVLTHKDSYDEIEVDKIDPSFDKKFVLFEILNSRYGFSAETVESLCAALSESESPKKFFSRQYVACTSRGRILVLKSGKEDECEVEIKRGSGKTDTSFVSISIKEDTLDNFQSLVLPKSEALLDLDKISFPLCLRRWKAGDAFFPLGMSGKKKVGDFLTDRKLSPVEKSRQMVLLSAQKIVWVVGERIDNRFRVEKKSTKRVLHLKME